MQTIESTFQNNVLAIPWMLAAEDENLDLEIHGCGCGCGSCGCACTCSCSCSCSCDDTGANEDDSDDYSDDYSASDDSSDGGEEDFSVPSLTTGPTAGDIGQCAIDTTSKGLEEGAEEIMIGAAIAKYSGGSLAIPGAAIAAAGVLDGAIDGAQASPACNEVVEDTKEMIAETAEILSDSDGFKSAVTTIMVAH